MLRRKGVTVAARTIKSLIDYILFISSSTESRRDDPENTKSCTKPITCYNRRSRVSYLLLARFRLHMVNMRLLIIEVILKPNNKQIFQ